MEGNRDMCVNIQKKSRGSQSTPPAGTKKGRTGGWTELEMRELLGIDHLVWLELGYRSNTKIQAQDNNHNMRLTNRTQVRFGALLLSGWAGGSVSMCAGLNLCGRSL